MTKRKMKITTVGLWLALILLLALPFATALTASAETGHVGAHPADAVAAEYFEEADGVYTCKSCGAQAVARVGTELYVEWAAALAAWENGETLTLLADLTGLTSTVTVSGTGKILDLNGKKLQSSVAAMAVTGDLTLRNSSTSRAVLEASSGYGILVTGTLRFTDGTLSVMGDTASIYSEGGTVAVSGGSLALLSTATDGVGLHNADATATLTVSGGTLSTRIHRRYGIHNVGTITVSGGTVDVRYNKRYAIYNEGLFTVGGGTVMAEAEDGGIYNDGTITLGGGTVFAEGTATYGRGIRNYSTLEAVAGSVLVFKDGEGQVITDALGNHTVVTVTVVKPLTVKRADGSAAVLGTDYTYGENGVLTLIGEGNYCVSLHPDVSASSHSILVDANVTLTLDGVKLHTADAAVLTVNADRTAVLKTTAAGAELKGDHNGIDNRGTLTVSGATLTVEATAFGMDNRGTLTISGATLTVEATTGGIYNEGTLTVEDTVLSASVATAEYPDSNTVFYNRGTITLRSSRVTARGSTVPLFNSSTRSHLTVESGELSVESESANSFALENVGTVTVSGGSVSLRMAGAGSFGILSNMGTLTVEGGQLTAVGEEIDIYHHHGTLTVSGGTVDGDVQSKFSQAVIVITGGHFLGEVVIEKGSLELRGGSFASLSVGTAVVASPGELIPNDYYAFRDGVPLNVEALVADGGYYSLGEVAVKKGADLTAFGTLTMSEGSFVYSGEAQCPTVTVTVAGRMLVPNTDYSVVYARAGVTTADLTTAGTVTVFAFPKEGSAYTGYLTASYTIERAAGDITELSAPSKTYDGAAVPAPTFRHLGDGAVTVEYKEKGAADDAYTATAPHKAGEYVVRVTVAEGTNHKATVATAELTVRKAEPPPVLWPTAAPIGYGQALLEATLESTDENGTFAWKNGSTLPSVTNSGYTVVYTPGDTENYDYSNVTLERTLPVEVSRRSVTVTAESRTVCVGTAYTLTYTVNGLLAGEALTVAPTLRLAEAVEGVGEYDILVTGAEAGDNYTVQCVGGTLTVRDHAYTAAVTVAPTCETAGERLYTCTHDATHTVTEAIEPLGHTAQVLPGKAPTCTEQGLTDGEKCEVCQAVLVSQSAIPALGHTYDNACDGDCNVCGTSRTPAAHGSQNADGLCDECGERFALSGGAIAGIVAGVAAALSGGGVALLLIRRKRRP